MVFMFHWLLVFLRYVCCWFLPIIYLGLWRCQQSLLCYIFNGWPSQSFPARFSLCVGWYFLSCLAYMSLFLFTRSNKPVKERGDNKKIRNRIYITCGLIMVLAILVVFVGGFLGKIPEDIYNNNHLTFWMEIVAVEAFGFSWLVKGETLFKS